MEALILDVEETLKVNLIWPLASEAPAQVSNVLSRAICYSCPFPPQKSPAQYPKHFPRGIALVGVGAKTCTRVLHILIRTTIYRVPAVLDC